MGSGSFIISIVGAACLITFPAYLAEPSDASRLGFYGEDYEGNLCGQLASRPDGSRGRDLRSRPFVYWLNTSATVCVRSCPRLADDLFCEYPFEAVPVAQKRAQLGLRCFSGLRTRPSFPACLPVKPSAAAPIDRWLSIHAVDQLAADTLQASAVILGSWCAAGLAALVCLGGLLQAPRVTLLLTMVAALATAFGGASMLLPHGTRILAAARAPLERREAVYWREEVPGALQFAIGWAACAAVGLLVLTLWGRARHAPIAAALLTTASKPLLDMPQLLVLPLYLFIAIGAPLSSWITAIVYLAAPCGDAEECGGISTFWRVAWPVTLAAPYWIAAAVTAWAYCAVGGAVGCWYADLAPGAGAGGGIEAASPYGRYETPLKATPGSRSAATPGSTSGYALGASRRWPLWRSGWLSLDSHLGAIGSAAFLLPFVTLVRFIVPPVQGPPRRHVNPYSRACLGAVQGCLRLLSSLTRTVHPGALVYISRHQPIGSSDGVGGTAADADSAAAAIGMRTPGGLAPASEDPHGMVGSSAGGHGSMRAPLGFLEAGEACARLFDFSESHVGGAREHAHFFYGLIKWTISLGCALVGWLCLTNADAPLLLSPIWPAAIILEGSFALASAALAVHEAALEAVLQSYCAEMRIKAAAAAADRLASESDPSAVPGVAPASESAADRAASLFGTADAAPPVSGYGSFAAGGGGGPEAYLPSRLAPYQLAPTYGTLATLGPSAGAPTYEADMADDMPEHLQVPPSYGGVSLAASALAGA